MTEMETQNLYSLPIDKINIISQRNDSPAHRVYHSDEHNADFDLTYAVDFLCDIGTPIRAALGGKVVFIQDGITKNWDQFEVPPKNIMSEDEQDGNYVMIEHPNKEFSIYSHLEPESIKVNLGNTVSTGDVLGHSGHTGWSIKPHLHFMVFKFTKPKPARDFVSLEINFSTNKNSEEFS